MKTPLIVRPKSLLHKSTGNFSYLLHGFLLSIVTIMFTSVSFSQDFNWITPNKTYLKLSIIDDGMYRFTSIDFTNAGINIANIDPRTVKLYNRGTEIPIFFQGESDGVFNIGDYLDFYGTRNYGGLTKYYTVDNIVFYQKDEFYNLYSDTNAYWIDWGGANGLRFTNSSYTTEDPYSSQTFTERFHFEKDRVYSQGERSGTTDYRYFTNEMFQGEGWYWSNMYNGLIITDTFTTPHLPVTPENCLLNFFAYPADLNYSVFNEHRMIIYINSTIIYDQYRNDLTRFNSNVTFSSSLLRNDTVNLVRAYYQAVGYDGHTFLDYMDIKCPRSFKFRNNVLLADLSGSDTTSRKFTVTGYSAAAPLFIYDVRNNQKITTYTFSGDTLQFTAKANARLEVHNRNITKKQNRVVQRQVPDLVSSANEADYIIVYNPLFESQAQQLADYRAAHDGFRVRKVKTTDIYDIFNFGVESPAAVRLFGKHAYNNWTTPRFKYLCLFGRGSLDPKKNFISTVYEKNLVPVCGYPNSDSYFANYNIGAFAFVDQVAVGRLPAYTTSEAQVMVDNIIMYESRSPESWMKNVLFVVGGGTAEDQQFNQSLILPFISNYVTPPPVSGNDHKAFRIDNTTTVTYNYKDSVRRDINNGDLLVNFQGHAGYENWEDAMQEPSTLDNNGKLPFILSMTCYTGKNADNTKRSFGEKFVTLNNKGAIGFLGSTGWGFVYSGNQFHDFLYKAFARDTVRRIGDIIKYGKTQIAYDSLGSVARHTINCYGLLGDPAVKLSLPVRPEFMIRNDGYRLSDAFPSLNQTVTMTVFPFNYGLHSDSCKIGFSLRIDNNTIQSYDTVLRSFRYSDSVRFTFRLDSIQNYSVHVVLDKDNWVPLEDKSGNTLSVDIPMKNNSYVQLRPVNDEMIGTDSVEFTGLNPITNQTSVKVILQLDTSLTYQSPLLMTFANDNISGTVTKFRAALPLQDTNRLYYWRTNSIIGGDTTGWTSSRSFSYFPALQSVANLSREGSGNISDNTLANVTIRKFKRNQFPVETLYNTVLADTGIGLTRLPLNLYVRSMGSSGAEISNFSVNDKAINYDGGRSPGLNMLKVRRVNGHIIEMKNFKLFNQSSMDSVVNFLNTFDSTYYLMALNASYVDYSLVQPLTETAKAKIRSFGSTKIDSMFKFGYFDTWSFIGYLGAGPSGVSEQYFKYTGSAGWRESQSSISTTCLQTAGTVANVIGPSAGWQNFSWRNILIPNSSVLFDVIGIENSGSQTTLMNNVSTSDNVDLSFVNSGQYPYLNFLSRISIDTMSGNASSVFTSLKSQYTLPAEIILDGSTIALNDSVLNAGDELKVNFYCRNAGYADVYGLLINSYKTSLSPSNLISSDTAYVLVSVDSSAKVVTKFTLPYYRTRGDSKMPLLIEAVPLYGQNEFYTYNNSFKFSITQNAVGSTPLVQIYSDDKLITGGEQINKNPEIRIEFNNGVHTNVSRSLSGDLTFKVNGQLISSFEDNTQLALSRKSQTGKEPSTGKPGSLIYRPSLPNGTNRLSVFYLNEMNELDSAGFDVYVSDVLAISGLYNFPNPMKGQTSFVFNISGAEPPDELSLGIYTTAGRKIKEIKFAAQIGDNIVEWDGRDNDGDAVANGTYIYKLLVKGGGQTQSLVQKLVVLR